MTWYQQLFGVQESHDYNLAQANFQFDHSSGILTSVANGRSFATGKFETPTLDDLRIKGLHALDAHKGKLGRKFQYHHVAQGDVLLEHAKYPGALFQAASQFNCLEFPSASTIPENGVTNYMYDGTQGPACSLACAAGTVVRNYFVDVNHLTCGKPETPVSTVHTHLGQRQDRQLNNLHLLETALRNYREHYFYVRNGYTFSPDAASLGRLSAVIRASKAEPVVITGTGAYTYEALKGLLQIGLHQDVGVTFATRYKPPTDGNITVSQAYCSALSCAYGSIETAHWEAFARLVLEASYEATLWAAALNALRQAPAAAVASAVPPASSSHASLAEADTSGSVGLLSAALQSVFHLGATGEAVATESASSTGISTAADVVTDNRHKVFLTFLGGGVFGNDMRWICDSIGRAMAVLSHHEAPIEVYIAHYGSIKPPVVEWIDSAYQRELDALQQHQTEQRQEQAKG